MISIFILRWCMLVLGVAATTLGVVGIVRSRALSTLNVMPTICGLTLWIGGVLIPDAPETPEEDSSEEASFEPSCELSRKESKRLKALTDECFMRSLYGHIYFGGYEGLEACRQTMHDYLCARRVMWADASTSDAGD